MVGSWAGAMGQTQFLPSAFLDHAVDGDGDGKIDLWQSAPDALASASRYLASLGWRSEYRWGREVLLPEGFDYAAAGRDRSRPLREWRELDVRDTSGNLLPALEIDTAILVPAGRDGPAFAIYANFEVIMRWNRSENFALAVGHLADRIAGAGPLEVPPPDRPPLARAELRALQEALAALGYDPGEPDGVLGPATRAAIRAFQSAEGLVADGYPTPEVLAAAKPAR
jgi:membrane-bound lytic murein transglycosylase B